MARKTAASSGLKWARGERAYSWVRPRPMPLVRRSKTCWTVMWNKALLRSSETAHPNGRMSEPMKSNPYNTDLDRTPANFQPLTPLTFLERAATVFPDHTAIIHGPLRHSYAAFYARSKQLASALAQMGIGRGDTVSALLANTPRHARMPLWRANVRRCPAFDQHPSRCRDYRLSTGSFPVARGDRGS